MSLSHNVAINIPRRLNDIKVKHFIILPKQVTFKPIESYLKSSFESDS